MNEIIKTKTKRLYLNTININKFNYIMDYLIGKKEIKEKIEYENRQLLSRIIEGLSDKVYDDLTKHLYKKRNQFKHVNPIQVDYYLDNTFELKFHFPKPVVKKFIKRIQKVNPCIEDKEVLYTLFYLRHLESYELGSHSFNVSRQTYRRGIFKVLESVSKIKNDMTEERRIKYRVKCLNDERWFSLIVDGTFAPIRSADNTFRGHKGVGVTYQVAILAENGFIYDVFGPLPASFHDVHIFKISPLSKLPLQENEGILADKGYKGPASMIIPFINNHELTEAEINFNHFISSQRQLVERTFCFLKYFRFLKIPWTSTLTRHRQAFTMICILHNIAIELNERNKIK